MDRQLKDTRRGSGVDLEREEKLWSTTKFESKRYRDHLIVSRRVEFTPSRISRKVVTSFLRFHKDGFPGYLTWGMSYWEDLSVRLNRGRNRLNVLSQRSRPLSSEWRGKTETYRSPYKEGNPWVLRRKSNFVPWVPPTNKWL